jgi:hypothetical protein
MTLQQMTVRAEQLHVFALPKCNLAVKGDPIFHEPFVVATASYVVDLEDAHVVDAASAAPGAEALYGLGTPLPVASLPGFAGEFLPPTWVSRAPGFDAGLLRQVDAGATAPSAAALIEGEVLDGSVFFAGPALPGFHGLHVAKPTVGTS